MADVLSCITEEEHILYGRVCYVVEYHPSKSLKQALVVI